MQPFGVEGGAGFKPGIGEGVGIGKEVDFKQGWRGRAGCHRGTQSVVGDAVEDVRGAGGADVNGVNAVAGLQFGGPRCVERGETEGAPERAPGDDFPVAGVGVAEECVGIGDVSAGDELADARAADA